MGTLHRKILRNLWTMKGQAVAIAFVIASGIATLVMSVSTLDSLQITRDNFYARARFADGFASLVRAPNIIRERLEEIPGIDRVSTRVVARVNLDIENYDDPVTAQLISLPRDLRPVLNDLYIRQGGLPDPEREDEVAISEAFAEAHGFVPGDTFSAIINGRLRELRIVGIVLSPEYIYQIAPSSIIPDFAAYGIVWMGEEALAQAYDLHGAFNDLSFRLTHDAVAEDVLDAVDDVIQPYGGLGAYLREDQLSHRFLHEEFRQLRQMAIMFPMVFLGVAAFLLNVVTHRLIQTQREQIAALKAFGYSNWAVGLHYLELVLTIVAFGCAIGVWMGTEFGEGLSHMYARYYKFPDLEYTLRPVVVLLAIGVAAGAAAAGNIFAVRRAAKLPPAEAMRPAPPAKYRVSIVERIGLQRFLSPSARMVIRHLERTPGKAFLSIVGIAFGCAILVLGMFMNDSIQYLIQIQFWRIQREDISVTLVEPTSSRAGNELRSLPGVERVEVYRNVPVRLRHRQHEHRLALQGVEPDSDLQRLLDADLNPIPLPEHGVVLTDHLARDLDCQPGDWITVEVLEGRRAIRQVPVARITTQFIGVSAIMSLDALSELIGEGPAMTGAYLAVDSEREQEVLDALDARPRVAGTAALRSQMRNFMDTIVNQLLTFAFFNTLLAMSIAFGVVYNSAQISVAEQQRELASLRVLGLTRGEISTIVIAELAILTLAAIPIGWVIGYGLSAIVATGLQTDLFRMRLVVDPSTYSFSALIIIISGAISALVVRRKLGQLDLVESLKTPE
ncbi:MAG: ABC transporter permease [Planctomycetes bacterium]|nr:ABC transporter permease [Planctomycetota bacterium]